MFTTTMPLFNLYYIHYSTRSKAFYIQAVVVLSLVTLSNNWIHLGNLIYNNFLF